MLLDPDILVAAIPGCEEFERLGNDEYKGVIAAKIGPVSSTYTTTFRVTDKNPPNSYRLLMDGQGPGGFVKADVLMTLTPKGTDETNLHYDADANVGGKIASIGQRMVKAGAGVIIRMGFKELSKRIEQELEKPSKKPA
jgi:carbon monoxide dehydrogenase subunit G